LHYETIRKISDIESKLLRALSCCERDAGIDTLLDTNTERGGP